MSVINGHLDGVWGKAALFGAGAAVAFIIGKMTGQNGEKKEYVPLKSKKFHAEYPLYSYTMEKSLRPNPVLEKLQEFTRDNVRWSVMLGCPAELQFLASLARSINTKNYIEVGTYTGSSTLAIAQVLPPDGKAVACDISEEYTSVAKPFWKEAGIIDKIDLRLAPASETLEQLLSEGKASTFDFAFIDADKTGYDNYYELCLKLLRKGGIIAIDNTLWGGKVQDLTITDEDTEAIRKLNDKIHKDDRVDANLLFLGDGTTIIFKR